MSAEENLKKLNIQLPKAADPVGSYVAIRISGNLLFISGQISMNENGELIKGKLGKDLNVDNGCDVSDLSDLTTEQYQELDEALQEHFNYGLDGRFI